MSLGTRSHRLVAKQLAPPDDAAVPSPYLTRSSAQGYAASYAHPFQTQSVTEIKAT
ncbi:hypothetical protein BVI1335_1220040 [Burkholderia vietnamiensis]|nr:hypothetical protein BVI1335_1220040 [Burkholderia vietnamiensis]